MPDAPLPDECTCGRGRPALDPLRRVCERFLSAPCAPGRFCSSIRAPISQLVESLRRDPAFVALVQEAGSTESQRAAGETRLTEEVIAAVTVEYLDGPGIPIGDDDHGDVVSRAERHLWRTLCHAARKSEDLRDRRLPVLPPDVESRVHLRFRLRRIGYALAAGSPTDCLTLLTIAERGGAPSFVDGDSRLPLLTLERREGALYAHVESLVEGLFLDRYRTAAVADDGPVATDWLPALLADVVDALGDIAVGNAAAWAAQARAEDERAVIDVLALNFPSPDALAHGSHDKVRAIALARRREGLADRVPELTRAMVLAEVPAPTIVGHIRAVHSYAEASASDYFGELHAMWRDFGGAADQIRR